jgi:FkbH-like protein
VVVLDCDNTLWQGVCGEDGPLGIAVTTPYRRLQEFMIGQLNAGMLLCLCSKNNAADVWDVFDQQPAMVLHREHCVSWRINWRSKSDNIRSLARELNLGLDSFIFVDDNPVECADVRINCPGVLALQLPGNTASLPTFLDHVWAFDHTGATAEDHSRTRMYQENTERERFRVETSSLADFIEGLGLKVDVAEATDDDLGRVSQLTLRTNQFNFTTVRRSTNEILEFLRREHATCLVVRVADRFGDYGLVGVVLYETVADRVKVDTLLLSCRVLGRGVEHAVLSELGRRAVGDAKRFVELAYRPTPKNAPVREFISSVRDRVRDETASSWTFAAEDLTSLAYDPGEPVEQVGEAPAPEEADRDPQRPGLGWGGRVADRSARLQLVVERLSDSARLAQAIEVYRLRNAPLAASLELAPTSALETALANIWKKVLGRPHIGMNDNFFEVGGTSLRAVQVIALIKKELHRNLSIVSLFECPTVALLAAKLQAASGEPERETAATGAVLRGQRRRNVIRRKAS